MELRDLAPAGIAFVVIAVTLGIGAEVLADVSAGQTGTAQGITDNGTLGLAELASWLPTLGLVLAAAVVIGTVVSFFAFRGR